MMDDGVPLAVSLFRPDATAPASGWPAILALHGLGQTRFTLEGATKTSASGLAREWADAGYVVMTFDARAHGVSGGLFTLAGPREIADVRALASWLAARPEVDEARIGGFGISYGGGALLRAHVEGVPFATLVPVATWSDLGRALFPQRLTKLGVIAGFFNNVPSERTDPELLRAREALVRNRNFELLRGIAAERSTLPQLSRVRVPVFWLQGRRDFFVDATQATAAFGRLGGPKRLFIGNLGHAPATNPAAERAYYLGQVRAWFDRFLKGMPNGIDTRANGIDTRAPVELSGEPWTGRTASYAAVPAVRRIGLTARARRTMRASGKVVYTFARTRRLLEQFGPPRVRVTGTGHGWPHLVAVLSALTPRGDEIVVSAGGAPTRFGRGPRSVTIELLGTVTAIPSGSRLRLTLAATSLAQHPANLLYLAGVPVAARLTVTRAALALPVLRRPVSR